ncbi:MAG: AbrB/MazE/SpoVT family DNA-binding domain-containing protein [Thermodesulfobacteriota bacterium]
MPISTISSKGQITLPADIRRKLGMKPNDRVLVEADNEAITIRPARGFLGLKGFAGPAQPADEENRKMAEAVAKHLAGQDL